MLERRTGKSRLKYEKGYKVVKKAVVLFNLGGPRSLKEVQPFLFNLFFDPLIIRLPLPLRGLVAFFLSRLRTKEATKIYEKLGGASPLYKNTLRQAEALEKALGKGFKVFIVMRYASPRLKVVLQEIKAFDPQQVILLPLYPHYSTTTTKSSYQEWQNLTSDLKIPTFLIKNYPTLQGFIEPLAERIEDALLRAKKFGKPRLLFTAHSLPLSIVKAGDPYPQEVQASVKAVLKKLKERQDFVICYQSKVGPLPWLTPSTEEEIKRAAQDQVPIIMIPISFVSEHSETLYEIDLQYKFLAKDLRVPYFERIETVGEDPKFINSLKTMIEETCLS